LCFEELRHAENHAVFFLAFEGFVFAVLKGYILKGLLWSPPLRAINQTSNRRFDFSVAILVVTKSGPKM